MLCDRRDRRCILESGSLYNTGNYPKRLPANRISHSATHVSQFSCRKPTRRGVRLLLPHTHQAATITNCSTIPSNGRQPDRSPELDTRQMPNHHFQPLRMPNTPSDKGPAVGTPCQPRSQADRHPQTHSSPSTLATESEGVYRQRCQTRGSEAVPVGEPITWCHRMVTARKKNRKPRRTVDMQVLNKHAFRETHHTQSPFHQATLVPAGTKKKDNY